MFFAQASSNEIQLKREELFIKIMEAHLTANENANLRALLSDKIKPNIEVLKTHIRKEKIGRQNS